MQRHQYVELDADPRAPAAARSRIEQTLVGRDRKAVDVAILLVSELVSNAVRHASHRGDPIGLGVRFSGGSLRIEVIDLGKGFDVTERVAQTDGFGLRIIDGLAEAWGVDPGPPHTVWCELAV